MVKRGFNNEPRTGMKTAERKNVREILVAPVDVAMQKLQWKRKLKATL